MIAFKKIPIMTCGEARAFEKRFFNPARDDGTKIVPAEADFMQRAGTKIGEFVLQKLNETVPENLLVLVGKGHNGGDALIAARTILRAFPAHKIQLSLVVFAEKWDELAPLTMDAYEAILRESKKPPTFFVTENSVSELINFLPCGRGVVLDGIYGHGFRAPLREHVFKAIITVNERARGSLRIAVDLPSGVSDASYTHYAFVADFTCATGILKTPLLNAKNASYVGRVVPLEIDFPADVPEISACAVEAKSVLAMIPKTRPVFCDKRDFGHLVIVGGSREMPGALMLNTLAALRAGAGLVTVLCPESVHAAFAARVPAAMWVPCKENAAGGLDSADTFAKLEKFFARANTILCGSGMGTALGTRALMQKIAAETPAPIALILDADALRSETLGVLRRHGKNILLPHAGEFARMGGDVENPQAFCAAHGCEIALKGAYTRVVSAGAGTLVCCAGTPALARGGSGDVLAGTIAGLFATRAGTFEKTAFAEEAQVLLLAGVVWHGVAAELLAGTQSVRCAGVESLPDFFATALR